MSLAWKLIIETLAICALITLYLIIRLRKGAVNWICLYEKEVQDKVVALGLTTREKIKKDTVICGMTRCIGMLLCLVACVVFFNRAETVREGFRQACLLFGFYNIYDGIVIDELWVMHTGQWVIPGTEEFRHRYITNTKRIKRVVGMILFFGLGLLLR